MGAAMTNELTEAEKQAMLDELDANGGKDYVEQEARNRQLKEMCLAARGRHYQSINKRKRHV